MPFPRPQRHRSARSDGERAGVAAAGRRPWPRPTALACVASTGALARGGRLGRHRGHRPTPHAADGVGLLAGGLRRWDLLLRRCAASTAPPANIHLNKPIVGMAGTADSAGYWLVASDGGIFSFGDAPFYGSTGSHPPQPAGGGHGRRPRQRRATGWWPPTAGSSPSATPRSTGRWAASTSTSPSWAWPPPRTAAGYWLVAADGGIFSFGDAHFYGSTGNIHLNKPIVGMTATPTAAATGSPPPTAGVFAFGDAAFYGSLGSVPQSRPIVAITGDRRRRRLLVHQQQRGGDRLRRRHLLGLGSPGPQPAGGGHGPGHRQRQLHRLVLPVGLASATTSPTTSAGNLPPSPHTIGVVEVVGPSMGAVNPCLAPEAQWAGGGPQPLRLPDLRGRRPSSGDPACAFTASPPACNFGFNAALDAFTKAQAAGVNTSVAWWLDVEDDSSWSSQPGGQRRPGPGGHRRPPLRGAEQRRHLRQPRAVERPSWATTARPCPTGRPTGDSTRPPPARTCKSQYSRPARRPGPDRPVQLAELPYPLGGMSTAYDNDYAC